MTIAYLVSEYPARSHTFIKREIDIMREQGFDLLSFSLHRCLPDQILNEEEQQAYDDTWSVFPIDTKALLLAHFNTFFSAPFLYLKGLMFGFSLSGNTFAGFFYTFFYFAEAMYLAQQLKEKDIEAIHVHFANSGAKVSAMAAKYLNVPWMLSLHGSVDFEYPAILWLQNMVKDAYFVRCVSDYGASQVKRVSVREEFNKVFVSYCGLPSSYQNITVPENKQRHTPLRLLAVGRLSPEKGQSLLLDAALELKQQGVDFQLELVGDGPDRSVLEGECVALGLEGSIHFHGPVEEKAVFDFMSNADILICPSFMEGLPQVLMESMLVATPVVAPYVAGIPELVSDRITGMLYPAGNVDAMSQAIVDLASDDQLYGDIVKAGRLRVLDKFLIDKTILPLVDKTQEIIS